MAFIRIPWILLLLLGMGLTACKDAKRQNQAKGQTVVEVKNNEYGLKNGDLIFQTSLSSQSKAIQIATKSKYSHCGIIFLEGDDLFVFEAGDKVERTALSEWIARGDREHFVVKRLKNADDILTEEVLLKMKNLGKKWEGKNYDWAFEWTDDKIYCSELLWKIYQQTAGVALGQLKTLRDFDLTHPEVQKKLKERYGDKIPLDEPVIAPQDVFESERLETVWSN